jgi:hypothetical protein
MLPLSSGSKLVEKLQGKKVTQPQKIEGEATRPGPAGVEQV